MGLESVYQRNLHHRAHRAGWLRAAVLGANDGLVSTASLMIGVNDVEESDMQMEIEHLAVDPEGELMELAQIYIERGLTPELAREVAIQMHARDPLEAHLRDELGQTPQSKARPMQAALASAASFTMGGLIPFAGAFAPTPGTVALSIVGFALAGLLVTGILSAKTAGKDVFGPTVRVMLGGAFGMAVTAGIGRLLHINLG